MNRRPALVKRKAAGAAECLCYKIPMPIIESIPNVSEGRRADVIERLADAIRRVPGARLLDQSSDTSHNRSVFTLAGDAAALKAATSRSSSRLLTAIDLRHHRGEHPRLGAVDVVPFVPIEGVTMADCVALAQRVGAAVAERFGVPVFLYEEASSNPLRKNLEDIRRGEFEGLAAKMSSPDWTPDFGAATPHPVRGRDGDRRAHAAHRLQHQPRHRPTRRREEDRGRDPPQQRRTAIRQSHGRQAGGPQPGAGLDEPHQLREDADLSRLRDGQA